MLQQFVTLSRVNYENGGGCRNSTCVRVTGTRFSRPGHSRSANPPYGKDPIKLFQKVSRSYAVSETSIPDGIPSFLTKKPKFLIVEDDPDYRTLFQHCLNEFDCDVLAAVDGKEAISVIKGVKLDLIFLDLKLPTISGVDVMRVAKQCQPSLPIIVITGYVDSEEAKEALKLGVLSVMEKPIDAANFISLFNTFKIRVRHKVVSPAGL